MRSEQVSANCVRQNSLVVRRRRSVQRGRPALVEPASVLRSLASGGEKRSPRRMRISSETDATNAIYAAHCSMIAALSALASARTVQTTGEAEEVAQRFPHINVRAHKRASCTCLCDWWSR